MSRRTTIALRFATPGGPVDGSRRGPGNRVAAGFVLLAAFVVVSIMLALPATASAGALVSNPGNGQDCAFFVAGKEYRGAGTQVITPNGKFILSCHLSLVAGTAVEGPTTTTIGNCELREVPSGEAHATCRFDL